MIELGKIQKLEIKRYTSVGVYLNVKGSSDENKSDVLLPKRQIPKEAKVGDEIEVFIYRDSEDRMIATTSKPKIALGEIGFLRVVEITKIGAFLDWGLEKDLFLPFREQIYKVQKGKKYLVGVYIDKSDRLCATMKIKDFLQNDPPYKENDRVKGMIYSINEDIGAFVAVDNKYDGLIPMRELYGVYRAGDEVDVRIIKVKENGKLDLTIKETPHIQIEEDAEKVLKRLEDNQGVLSLNDESSPEDIKKELHMSKTAFKKSVGKLLKEKKIQFTKNGIRIK
ncbi:MULTISPECIES: CvfB family protein [Tissierellales]|jgi:hypothetical protein|uniref:S1 RNA-binding domain-containing protein n=1 Tax=Acidilutibacter cellobiosedens TaxID=2507161 RepID=A0A410QH10_9FIRM|nr:MULTISPECIES: S1-like domain-containing RNA-binding protein [Tissierellales]MBE6082494.1 S1 RNA-binding domain-containing protein [Tissierellaceae bacterium]QAT63392.1 S1 RNA-binding domain-containing protein [Acidilutibacter cellobiosedens]SCL93788.1 hypothetical protein PP176A_2554 [Sporanaerobacter sp. PP17-6a]